MFVPLHGALPRGSKATFDPVDICRPRVALPLTAIVHQDTTDSLGCFDPGTSSRGRPGRGTPAGRRSGARPALHQFAVARSPDGINRRRHRVSFWRRRCMASSQGLWPAMAAWQSCGLGGARGGGLDGRFRPCCCGWVVSPMSCDRFFLRSAIGCRFPCAWLECVHAFPTGADERASVWHDSAYATTIRTRSFGAL